MKNTLSKIAVSMYESEQWSSVLKWCINEDQWPK